MTFSWEDDLHVTRFEPAGNWGYYLAFVCGDSDRFRQAVEGIKRLLPHERAWMPEAPGGRAWWIASAALPTLRWVAPDMAEAIDAYRRGAGADHAHAARAAQHRPHRRLMVPFEVEHAFAILYLRPDAPPQVVRAAYRALAPLNHPDTGGDEAAMTRLNLAHERALQWAEEHAAVAVAATAAASDSGTRSRKAGGA